MTFNLEKNKLTDLIYFQAPRMITLNCKNNEIRWVEIKEGFPFLESLDLSNNNLIDFSKITELQKLNYLNLQGNKIKSLNFLNKFKSLANLNLSKN